METMGRRLTSLPRADDCSLIDNNQYFDYQYQGGRVEQDSLMLPRGMGVPVGRGSPFRTIIMVSHFDDASRLVNDSTVGSSVEVSLMRTSSNVSHVFSLKLVAYGLVGGQSVGSVTAKWLLEEDVHMHLLLLYTHWHALAIRVEVWIERRESREGEAILIQDPRSFKGITDVSNSSLVMKKDDRLLIRCTYNNTDDETLLIE